MTVRATSLNPDILRWAREGLGLSIEEVAERMGRSSDVIEAWESGSAFPTFNQLERLADTVFKRPVAVFFFSAPPEEPPIDRDFRTLPSWEFERLDRDTRLAIREAMAYQISLAELSGGQGPEPEALITHQLASRILRAPSELAAEARDILGVSLAAQQSWRSADEAFKAWRRALEDSGVWVFKRSLDQRAISGFCLHHSVYPLILVNNSTPHTRQVFTLFHELAHLLYGVSSITRIDSRWVDRLEGDAKAIEVRCNEFAGEFLMPVASFPWNEVDLADLDQSTARIAELYSVSREVVLRRLVDRGRVSQAVYERKAQEWAIEAQEARQRSGSGGSYYANQATYLSGAFLDLGFSQYRAGNVTRADLADHFGMRAETVGRLEDYLLTRKTGT